MDLSVFDWYLIIINVIGFVVFGINTLLYKYTEDANIDAIVTIVSLLFGSLGIVIAILLFDRKAIKDNMMSRVFVACVLVIQIILFLIIKGYIRSNLTINVIEFFSENKWLLYYLIGINLVAFVVYGIDKLAAIMKKSRIRIVTLLLIAFIGGSVGALLAMYTFRHKTRKDYFAVGVPLIIIMQLVVLFYVMNM